MIESNSDTALTKAFKFILALGLICVALLLTLIYLVLRPPSHERATAAALQDPAIRQQAINKLVADSAGIYDSHVDADVGRIGQPNLENRPFRHIRVSTNNFGLREHPYELPKPPDTVRIVLLGDSFVFGYSSHAESRMGVFLENWLKERAIGFKGRIECLHIGIASWDIVAESAYLRRQLSELQPDLVFHFSVPNDIEGTNGVRGFGAPASFYPRHRHRADSIIRTRFPVDQLGFEKNGYLRYGLDYEGKRRYAEAREHIQRLAQAVEQAGGSYRLVLHFSLILPTGWQFLGRHLPEEQVVYLARSFATDKRYWFSEQDAHWSPDGHLKISKLLYGLITRDHLLPQLNLPEWEEADRVVQDIAGQGKLDAMQDLSAVKVLKKLRRPLPASRIDFENLNSAGAIQIHGGIDNEQRVAPYASFILKNPGGKTLYLKGATFPKAELDGAKVRIFVDGKEVGRIIIKADTELDLQYSLPQAVLKRRYLSIRFKADDYVYQGEDLQHCVVFWLKSLAIE